MRKLALACSLLVACHRNAHDSGGGTTAAPTPSPKHADGPVPPKAERRPHVVESPNGNREDPYYWLRDDTRKDPDVLAYLNAENAYTTQIMAPVKALEDQLFAEMRGRVQEDDASVPTFDNGYWYYTRFEQGKQQPLYCRKKATLAAPEEVLLDGNALAEGHAFYRIGSLAVSLDNKLLAWTEDAVGRNQFTLRVRSLVDGKLLPDTATNITPSVEWANDHQTLFFVGKDPTTLRSDRVFRQQLGKSAELVFQEPDGQYYVGIGATKSHRYVEIALRSTTNSEVRLIDADKPASAPRVLLPREKDHIYSADHLDGRFVIRTNQGGKNFRIVEVADGKERDRAAWKDLIPHRADQLVESFALYRKFIAATVRTGGLRKVLVLEGKAAPLYLDAPDPSYAMTAIDTPDPDAKAVRFAYDSMVAPHSTYELDLATKQRTLLKQQPVPTYDPTLYTSEYVHATAKDGTKVPVSLVYKKTTKRDGSAPLMVYGYGSYGHSMEPGFANSMVSLLDRGWVYAIAHIRGGQEMGRAWYEDGKLMKKMNTFTDFIAATEFLVAQKYGAPDHVYANGGSAGGLLMGAIVNLRPDLYRGIAALVPFVDVVTTMLDESIPLTTNEFDEWGNPKQKAAYDYMLSYSPYDNVKAQDYPAIFIHTGLWDSQVQYYEPAKWVAKLRATKTDSNPLVFDIDMTSGHGGASGRFDALRQRAKMVAFFLMVQSQPDRRKRVI